MRHSSIWTYCPTLGSESLRNIRLDPRVITLTPQRSIANRVRDYTVEDALTHILASDSTPHNHLLYFRAVETLVQFSVISAKLWQLWRALSSHMKSDRGRLSANGHCSVEPARSKRHLRLEAQLKIHVAKRYSMRLSSRTVAAVGGLTRFSPRQSEDRSPRRSPSLGWRPLPQLHEHYPGHSASVLVWTAT